MLTRVYINNFRCLVDFELRLGPRQLIMGANGAGKSSFLDALLLLRRLLVLRQSLERHNNTLDHRTAWLNSAVQTFEMEVSLDNATYVYRLEVEAQGNPEKPRVQSESVRLDGKMVFEFRAGEVRLFDDQFQPTIAYPFEPDRSALSAAETRDNRKLVRFKEWMRQLLVFRLNPFDMKALAKAEDADPHFDLSNFAAWYRHLVQSAPRESKAFLEDLRSAIDGFEVLQFSQPVENMRLLSCMFLPKDGADVRMSFDQLSDGQRCLVGLYTILHFVIAKGYTVVLDEPDNFIALREIQPWLAAVSANIDEYQGQVLILSHHPELMNQWAPDYGIRFVRDGMGPVRVKEFNALAYSTLTPAEVVARGWENE